MTTEPEDRIQHTASRFDPEPGALEPHEGAWAGAVDNVRPVRDFGPGALAREADRIVEECMRSPDPAAVVWDAIVEAHSNGTAFPERLLSAINAMPRKQAEEIEKLALYIVYENEESFCDHCAKIERWTNELRDRIAETIAEFLTVKRA